MYYESKEKLQEGTLDQLIERSGTVVVWWDGEGKCFYRGQQFLELSLSDVPATEIFEDCEVGNAVWVEDIDSFVTACKEAYQGNVGYDFLARLAKKDGTYIWCQLQLTIYKDAKGSDNRGICFIINREEMESIRERKDEILQRSKALLAMMPCGIVILEATKISDLRITFVSDEIKNLYGYSPKDMKQLIGLRAQEMFYAQDWKENFKTMVEITGKNTTFESTMRIRNSKGEYVWTAIRARRVGESLQKFTVCVILFGVSKEKERELLLQDQNENLSSAVYDTKVTVWKEDIIGHCVIRESIIGDAWERKGVYDNLPKSLLLNKVVQEKSKVDLLVLYSRLKTGEQEISAEIWFSDAKKQEWCEKITYRINYDDDGNPLYAVGSSQDITYEKKMEQQLQQEVLYRSTIQKSVLVSAVLNLSQNRVLSIESKHPFLVNQLNLPTVDEFLSKETDLTLLVKDRSSIRELFDRDYLLSQFSQGTHTLHITRESYILEKTPLWNEVTITLSGETVSGDVFAVYFADDISISEA